MTLALHSHVQNCSKHRFCCRCLYKITEVFLSLAKFFVASGAITATKSIDDDDDDDDDDDVDDDDDEFEDDDDDNDDDDDQNLDGVGKLFCVS